jgi:hypothetical protein
MHPCNHAPGGRPSRPRSDGPDLRGDEHRPARGDDRRATTAMATAAAPKSAEVDIVGVVRPHSPGLGQ